MEKWREQAIMVVTSELVEEALKRFKGMKAFRDESFVTFSVGMEEACVNLESLRLGGDPNLSKEPPNAKSRSFKRASVMFGSASSSEAKEVTIPSSTPETRLEKLLEAEKENPVIPIAEQFRKVLREELVESRRTMLVEVHRALLEEEKDRVRPVALETMQVPETVHWLLEAAKEWFEGKEPWDRPGNKKTYVRLEEACERLFGDPGKGRKRAPKDRARREAKTEPKEEKTGRKEGQKKSREKK